MARSSAPASTRKASMTTRKALAALKAAVRETVVLEPDIRSPEESLRMVLAHLMYASSRRRAFRPDYFSIARLVDILERNGLAVSGDGGRSFRPTELGALVPLSAEEVGDARDVLRDKGY